MGFEGRDDKMVGDHEWKCEGLREGLFGVIDRLKKPDSELLN
jgi:hypothetical protein